MDDSVKYTHKMPRKTKCARGLTTKMTWRLTNTMMWRSKIPQEQNPKIRWLTFVDCHTAHRQPPLTTSHYGQKIHPKLKKSKPALFPDSDCRKTQTVIEKFIFFLDFSDHKTLSNHTKIIRSTSLSWFQALNQPRNCHPSWKR